MPTLDIALKEWAVVCDMLAQGRTALLLRKGGIHEFEGPGRFALEHDQFLMFPAWEHERLDWIKKDWLPGEAELKLDDADQIVPTHITFKGYVQVAKIWSVPSRAAFETLDDLHPWDKPQIDMRFNYKPDRPIYLLALRAYALAQPAVILNSDAFSGCRSWVPLGEDQAVDLAGATPAMDDAAFAEIVARCDAAMSVAASISE